MGGSLLLRYGVDEKLHFVRNWPCEKKVIEKCEFRTRRQGRTTNATLIETLCIFLTFNMDTQRRLIG